jgi:hypothetical protein
MFAASNTPLTLDWQIMGRQKFFIIFLWLSVINLSIWIGGTLFHMIVVLPIWSQPLPESVKEFFGGTPAYEYLLDFYGPKWMIIRILSIIVSLLLGWNSKRHRYFILITVNDSTWNNPDNNSGVSYQRRNHG